MGTQICQKWEREKWTWQRQWLLFHVYQNSHRSTHTGELGCMIWPVWCHPWATRSYSLARHVPGLVEKTNVKSLLASWDSEAKTVEYLYFEHLSSGMGMKSETWKWDWGWAWTDGNGRNRNVVSHTRTSLISRPRSREHWRPIIYEGHGKPQKQKAYSHRDTSETIQIKLHLWQQRLYKMHIIKQ